MKKIIATLGLAAFLTTAPAQVGRGYAAKHCSELGTLGGTWREVSVLLLANVEKILSAKEI